MKNRWRSLLLLVTFLSINGQNFVEAIELLSFSFQKLEQKGYQLFWWPQKAADRFVVTDEITQKTIADIKPKIQVLSQVPAFYKDKFAQLRQLMPGLNFEDNGQIAWHESNVRNNLIFSAVYDLKFAENLGIYTFFATPAKKYSFKVSSYLGGTLQETAVIQGEFLVKHPPPVESVEAVGIENAALIRWKPLADKEILGYNVYYSNNKKNVEENDYVKMKIGNETLAASFKPVDANRSAKDDFISFTLQGLKNDTEIFVRVNAVYLSQMESQTAKILKVTPGEKKLPIAPELTIVEQQNNAVIAKISWKKSSSQDIRYYHLYRSDAFQGNYQLINKVPIPEVLSEFFDPGPFEFNKTYWYRMVSVNKEGHQSAQSAALYFRPQKRILPGLVPITKIEAENGSLKIFFKTLDDRSVIRYEIYRAATNSDSYAKIGDYQANKIKAGNEIFYHDLGLDSRVSYCYLVKAMDQRGNFSPSTKPSCGSAKNAAILDAVINLHGFMDSQMVTLNWKYEPHSLLTGFAIYRRDLAARPGSSQGVAKRLNHLPLDAGLRIFFDRNIEPGVSYEYTIRPIGENNILGAESKPVKVETSVPRPQPVSNLSVYEHKEGRMIQWQYFSEVKSFYIYSESLADGKPVLLKSTTVTSFLWQRPPKGLYYIYVIAENHFNKKSGPIPRVRVDIP